MRLKQLLGCAVLATALSPFAQAVCCSIVVLHPSGHWNELMRYIVTDKWAYCTTGGDITVWIAEDAFVLHEWITRAENSGHCVLY